MSPLGKLELVRFGDCSGELVYGTAMVESINTQVLLVLILNITDVDYTSKCVCLPQVTTDGFVTLLHAKFFIV